jgi:hypothetical protein
MEANKWSLPNAPKKCAIRDFSNIQLLSERTEEKTSTDFLHLLFAVCRVA